MFNFRTPTPPMDNLPKVIVDFVTLIKDPEWLASMATAAQEITKANQLTEEESQYLKDALATIEEAKKTKAVLAEGFAKISHSDAEFARREAIVTKRESQTDERNTALAEREGVCFHREEAAALSHSEADKRHHKLFSQEKEYENRVVSLNQRESAIALREKAFNQAKAIVNG